MLRTALFPRLETDIYLLAWKLAVHLPLSVCQVYCCNHGQLSGVTDDITIGGVFHPLLRADQARGDCTTMHTTRCHTNCHADSSHKFTPLCV